MIQIPLTQNQCAIVSPEDADLAEFKWIAQRQRCGGFYATRRKPNDRRRIWFMHRLILERVIGRPLLRAEEVDHIDLNKLNNQRSNLRIATKTQNMHNRNIRKDNRTGHTGVSWHSVNQKWVARITVDRHEIYLGIFDNLDDAVHARHTAVIKYYGEFGRLD